MTNTAQPQLDREVPAAERAGQAGHLYGVARNQVREAVIGAQLGECTPAWTRAVTAACDAAEGDLSKQIQFDAYWLHTNVTLLAAESPGPESALLTAATHAIEAAVTMIALARAPHGEGSVDARNSVLNSLACAFHMAHTQSGMPARNS